jgi:hypothetical protein
MPDTSVLHNRLGFPPHVVAHWSDHTLSVQERHDCEGDNYLPPEDGYDFAEFGVLSEYGKRGLFHQGAYSREMAPPADRAFAALLDDLSARGMLDETLVVWVGEFGRKPHITAGNAGREHWPHCSTPCWPAPASAAGPSTAPRTAGPPTLPATR